jgi:S-DNA-T family DNA segregation ATPase FtsK/SpoIIIE
MAKKKKREKREKEDKKKKDQGPREPLLKEETLQAVLGIIFAVLGVFFILAAASKAGRAGNGMHENLTWLLGLGYYLLPILSFMLCASFFKSLKKNIALLQGIGSALFFFSGLGLIGTLALNEGGVVGTMISGPLISLFDTYATFIILAAIFAISIIVMFDIGITKEGLMFWRKEPMLDEEGVPLAKPLSEPLRPETQPKLSGMDISKKEGEPVPALNQKDKREKIGDAPDILMSPARLSLKEFVPPPLSLLESDKGKPGVGDIKANANIIKRTLQNFGIIVEMDEITIGPSVTRYAFKPAEGVKLSKILGLQNNLELALAASPIRIEAPIPGKSLVGIEVPNTAKAIVGLAGLLASDEFTHSAKPLLMSLGKGISGESHYANLGKMPHLLIAGATGAGKSVTIHTLITSLLFRNSPESLKFIMVDPKRVELTLYNQIPHLLTPVITEPKKAILALKWAAKEMDRRYDILGKHQVRDIDSYHKNILEPEIAKLKKKGGEAAEGETLPELMPYIVVVVDELADIMQAYPRELEAAIVRLAQMSRAVGIHLIIATQRPSVNVITGLIKANIPARIALQVVSGIDSRTILDTVGAEKLLGAGDMLFMSGDMSKPTRVQSAFISENELKKIVKYLADNYRDEIPSTINLDATGGKNALFDAVIGDSDGSDDDDDLYEDAREAVLQAGKASTSFLQRKLRVGYARAARLIDLLEERGVVGPGSGAKPREVLGGTSSEAAEYGAEEGEM